MNEMSNLAAVTALIAALGAVISQMVLWSRVSSENQSRKVKVRTEASRVEAETIESISEAEARLRRYLTVQLADAHREVEKLQKAMHELEKRNDECERGRAEDLKRIAILEQNLKAVADQVGVQTTGEHKL